MALEETSFCSDTFSPESGGILSLCPADFMLLISLPRPSLSLRSDEKPSGENQTKSSKLRFDQSPVRTLATSIKWSVGPRLGQRSAHGHSRCFLRVTLSDTISWPPPGTPLNPGQRWLHVAQTVSRPCKRRPSWHKAPLIWRTSKRSYSSGGSWFTGF